MSQNLILVHIQKTGGSSLAAGIGQKVLSPHKHRFASELKIIYGEEVWNSSYKFAFVRNPWDRLVSWWTMINGFRPFHQQGRFINNFFKYVFENCEDFEGFISHCHADVEDDDGWKCILRNQLDYIVDDKGALMVDYIGRFETLTMDFEQVLANVGWSSRPLGHHNWTRHKPYQSYYSPKTRAIIEEAYVRDIERFGYRFEDHVAT